jgi:hypothetical protein
MRNINHATVNSSSDLSNDLNLLSELPPSWTPEFLMKVTQPVTSTDRAAMLETLAARVNPSAAGHSRITRDVLMSPDFVEKSIQSLRAMLLDCDKKRGASDAETLIESWIAVESCLTADERQELLKGVLTHAFPKSSHAARISRASFSIAEGE